MSFTFSDPMQASKATAGNMFLNSPQNIPNFGAKLKTRKKQRAHILPAVLAAAAVAGALAAAAVAAAGDLWTLAAG